MKRIALVVIGIVIGLAFGIAVEARAGSVQPQVISGGNVTAALSFTPSSMIFNTDGPRA
jgi:hypothetical protein